MQVFKDDASLCRRKSLTEHVTGFSDWEWIREHWELLWQRR